jgi:hypothetical protein
VRGKGIVRSVLERLKVSPFPRRWVLLYKAGSLCLMVAIGLVALPVLDAAHIDQCGQHRLILNQRLPHTSSITQCYQDMLMPVPRRCTTQARCRHDVHRCLMDRGCGN